MMDPVNIVINAFVFRFYPSRYINLSLKLLSLIRSCQLFDFGDQFPGFLLGDKPGGLNSIYQQL